MYEKYWNNMLGQQLIATPYPGSLGFFHGKNFFPLFRPFWIILLQGVLWSNAYASNESGYFHSSRSDSQSLIR